MKNNDLTFLAETRLEFIAGVVWFQLSVLCPQQRKQKKKICRQSAILYDFIYLFFNYVAFTLVAYHCLVYSGC